MNLKFEIETTIYLEYIFPFVTVNDSTMLYQKCDSIFNLYVSAMVSECLRSDLNDLRTTFE